MSVEGSAASEIAASLEASETQESENQFGGVEAVEHNEEAAQAEEDGFSRKFAALSRKEREFREHQSQWDADRAELEEYRRSKQEAESKANQKEEQMPLDYRLKRNPLETLAELGLDYETLTNLAINDGKMTPEMQMKLMQEDMLSSVDKKYGSRIEELQNQLEAKEQAEAQYKEQKAVAEFNNKISSHIESNAEAYELINANGANDLVYDVIEQHYNETERVLDIKDAAEAVESYLMEEAEKFMKLNKIKKLSQPQDEPKLFRESPTTLSNVQSASTPKLAERKLSIEESKKSAAQLIKWD